MGGRFGVLFFLLGLLTCWWSCDARDPILLQPLAHDDNQVCELCDKYVTLAIDYLQDYDNQNALVEALHISCSQIPPLKKQCLSMVDHYTQLFFTQVSTITSDQICKRLNLCQAATPPFASQVHQGNCEACRQTVSEVVAKLKDPQTKLKIIRLLLKECKSLNNYQDKCKKMVFEYGPLMLTDLEKFLEKKDVCFILHVCPGPATHHGYIPTVEALADS
ncbi:prosaposin isoform X2 [Arabidopsis lyrata subsp. lyrata]|uniref:prosaposin isoform X2 n=1 Tax=Arabidopsis lyrata subsp. lyrata TaxID=81972 RepID=UPI000A29A5B3|nr:prosaposin isoform X2 [Arabidopsis lyrata subsp. lyrata]|eukprot:XP_020878986.1 prosaposin isoform X2 [Arabidopsis lyrata subsp. lyrata]